MDYLRTPGRKRGAIRESKHFRRAQLIAFPVALAVLAALSSFLQNVTAGEIVIIIYAAAALVLRIASATTFRIAFICLLFVPAVTIASGADSDLVQSFAVYAFLLLVVGVLSILAEQLWAAPWMFRFKKAPQNLEKSLDK